MFNEITKNSWSNNCCWRWVFLKGLITDFDIRKNFELIKIYII